VVSDRAARGVRPDATGPALREFVAKRGASDAGFEVVEDEKEQLICALMGWCSRADLVLTAGGTGLAARDVTPEATAMVAERLVPGLAEAMRAAGLRSTPHAALSRGVAGVRGRALMINLPGSPVGAVESLAAIWEALPHAVALLRGSVADEEHAPQR